MALIEYDYHISLDSTMEYNGCLVVFVGESKYLRKHGSALYGGFMIILYPLLSPAYTSIIME